ncbi:MAG TPA: hypothetical protein VHT23_03565 [Gemmatimonadaceae bacterium]|nr:hypothetical protein [Gemmatimonadaceae bacterium]
MSNEKKERKTDMFFMKLRIIHRSIAALRIEEVTTHASIQAATYTSLVDRVLKIYKALMPFLTLLAGVPLIPPTWRAALTAFLQALDLLAAASSSEEPVPVTASAAADTITDPASSDPSFKAGKDL